MSMQCGVCGQHFTGGMLHLHYTRCMKGGLAPEPTINDIKKNSEENDG